MASKTLVLLGLFALVLVVSESAVASRTQPDMVKSKEETVQPNQQGYGGNGGNGAIGYGGGGARPCCSHAGEAVQTLPGH